MLDPTGTILTSNAAAATAGKRGRRSMGPAIAEPVALGYRFVATDLRHKFPDQFAPFEALPFGFSLAADAPYRGTIIRLPLRAVPSPLSNVCVGVAPPEVCGLGVFAGTVEGGRGSSESSRLLDALAPLFLPITLFTVHVEAAMLSLWPPDASAPLVLVSNQLQNPGVTCVAFAVPLLLSPRSHSLLATHSHSP